MRVWTSDYKLYPKGSLGRISSNPIFRYGSLLKFEFEDGVIGYSDLCPYPQLGDAPTKDQLNSLRNGNLSSACTLSMEYARRDGEARSQHKSLLSQNSIANNYLIQSLEMFNFSNLKTLQDSGFNSFKIKVRGNLDLFTQVLVDFTNQLSEGSTIRLDFNSRISYDNFNGFMETIADKVSPFIEFLEDPLVFDVETWKTIKSKWGLPLALDRISEACWENVDGIVDVVIVKPAIDNSDRKINFFTAQDIVFTHYLDYPVGQVTALSEALRLKHTLGNRLRVCGLNALDCFEDSDFSRAIDLSKPIVMPQEGTGIGFDNLFESILWTPL